jgi:hypothetical protein
MNDVLELLVRSEHSYRRRMCVGHGGSVGA